MWERGTYFNKLKEEKSDLGSSKQGEKEEGGDALTKKGGEVGRYHL